MKKTIWIMVILSSIFMGLSFFDKVDASIRYNFDVTKPYGGLPDSEKMLKLPDGGLLYGKMVTSDKETGKILETFDSHTDSNSLSISELKKEPSKVAPLRMSPPSEVRTLGANAFYQSSPFSSSGLRFGGYYFQAASGTGGTYLLWGSHGDSGLVGSPYEAEQTYMYSDPAHALGTIVGNNQQIYKNGRAYYYTFNPANGSYYGVANR